MSKELAETHWKWLASLLHKVYVDAFNHGYKHGKEEAEHEWKTNIKSV